MNLSTYIARRYFFSKKSGNAVNLITGISVVGISVGTAALIIVLSVFNGLEGLVKSFYNTFDPDLKVEVVSGKYFVPEETQLEELSKIESVLYISSVLEERALLNFQEKEYIATLKGVDPYYTKVSNFADAISSGTYQVGERNGVQRGVLGIGVAYYLGYSRVDFESSISVYVPKADASVGMDFSNAFSSGGLYPSGIFSIQPEYDEQYLISSLDFAQNLLNRKGAVTALEIKLEEGTSLKTIQKEIVGLFGEGYTVKNRDEQQSGFMKVMKSESLFTFLVFALILTIATFTIMGSLTMLILDKKDNLRTLWAMGTDEQTLKTIFFKEGLLIGLVGAVSGLILGVGIVLIQDYFGLVALGQGYVVEAYPVALKLQDVVLVMATVIALSGLTSWLTSQRFSLKLFSEA